MINYTSDISPYDIGRMNFTVRLLMKLKDEVDPCCLEKAVSYAMTRYPYFKKKLIRSGEKYLIVDNELPVVVYENTGKSRDLNSQEVNEHLVSVDYSGKMVGLNMSHMLAGGFGIFELMRTILYCYISDRYSVSLTVEDLRLPEEPLEAGERDFLTFDKLPDVKPLAYDRIKDGELPLGDYMASFTNPERASDCYYHIEFSQKDFMGKAKTSDGSPATLLSALMFRMLYKVWGDRKKPIQSKIMHNYRNEVGCPNTTCDLVRSIHVCYPDSMADASLERLCTITRGAVILQSQAENAIYDGKRTLERLKNSEKFATLEEKVAYCQQNKGVSASVQDSFMVSYTGRTNWGDMIHYIEAGDVITDGHLMLEVTSLGDKICVAFEQVVNDTKYIEAFTRELEKEDIPYTLSGPFEKNMAAFKLP